MNAPLTDHDKRLFEHHEKDRKGYTTVGNLFCEDQLTLTKQGRDNFDQINWKKSGCQWATCKFWNTSDCPEPPKGPTFDAKKHCILYGK